MRILPTLLLLVAGSTAHSDTLEAFKARIEVAIEQHDKTAAVRALFYQQGLSGEMQQMLSRVVTRVARRSNVTPSFSSPRRRNSRIRSSPILYPHACPGQPM